MSAALAAAIPVVAFDDRVRGAQRPVAAQAPRPATSASVVEGIPSELLAVQMLELSAALRASDSDKAALFFTDGARLALPTEPARSRPKVRWIRQHGWRPGPGSGSRKSRPEIAIQWNRFLAHFARLEHLRIDVTQVDFDERTSAATANVALSVVGRDEAGRREWARGLATLKGSRSGPRGWLISEFRVHTLESLMTTVDLFSDVSALAGVVRPWASLGAEPAGNRHVARMLTDHGAAAGDVDGDRDIDLVVIAPDRIFLYLNRGDGSFTDGTESAGLRSTPLATAPLLSDLDNDGDLDIFMSAVGQQMVFENRLRPEGHLRFEDVSLEARVSVDTAGFSVVVGDVNNDGLPDVYVCGYNRSDSVIPNKWHSATNGTANLLFLNRGHLRFEEVARQVGVDDTRWSLDAELVDFDGDGDQDLYVANDFSQNALYLNLLKETGKLRFRDVASEIGASRPGFGMGVSFGDYDNDGDLDIHATYMSAPAADRMLHLLPVDAAPVPPGVLRTMLAGNALYENRGNGTFREVSERVGPFRAGWAWGGGFLDFDNDGWADLHSVNGMMSANERYDAISLFIHAMTRPESTTQDRSGWAGGQEVEGLSLAGHERDTLYLNLRRKRYLDISGISGLDSITDGRGAVYADFDDDGDLDVFITALAGPAQLFRNNVGQAAPSLRVVLQGTRSGRDAFGAVARLKSAVGIQTKVKAGGEGHISQHDPRLLFGLGDERGADWLEIAWPSGLKQRFRGLPTDGSIRIVEGATAFQVLGETSGAAPGPSRPRVARMNRARRCP